MNAFICMWLWIIEACGTPSDSSSSRFIVQALGVLCLWPVVGVPDPRVYRRVLPAVSPQQPVQLQCEGGAFVVGTRWQSSVMGGGGLSQIEARQLIGPIRTVRRRTSNLGSQQPLCKQSVTMDDVDCVDCTTRTNPVCWRQTAGAFQNHSLHPVACSQYLQGDEGEVASGQAEGKVWKRDSCFSCIRDSWTVLGQSQPPDLFYGVCLMTELKFRQSAWCIEYTDIYSDLCFCGGGTKRLLRASHSSLCFGTWFGSRLTSGEFGTERKSDYRNSGRVMLVL